MQGRTASLRACWFLYVTDYMGERWRIQLNSTDKAAQPYTMQTCKWSYCNDWLPVFSHLIGWRDKLQELLTARITSTFA